jgi:hypothetical protein
MKVEQAKQVASKAIEELTQALEMGHSEKLKEYLTATWQGQVRNASPVFPPLGTARQVEGYSHSLRSGPSRKTHSSCISIQGRKSENCLLLSPLNQRSLNCIIDAKTLRAFLLFLYGTGAYVGEALRLRTTDIDLEEGIVKVRRVAGARERTLPVAGYIRNVLLSYRNALPESYRTSQAFFGFLPSR